MKKKSFFIGFSAVFLVFSLLLLNLVFKVYHDEKTRPLIYNCFTYEGNYSSLKSRLEVESKYIDRFIILQSLDGKCLSDEEKKELIQSYLDKAIFVSIPQLNYESMDASHFLKGLGSCKERDVVLFSSLNQRVEFKSLYQSLRLISKSSRHVFKLKAFDSELNLSQGAVDAMNYKAFKMSLTQNMQSKLKIKKVKKKRRNFFFLTHPYQKEP